MAYFSSYVSSIYVLMLCDVIRC